MRRGELRDLDPWVVRFAARTEAHGFKFGAECDRRGMQAAAVAVAGATKKKVRGARAPRAAGIETDLSAAPRPFLRWHRGVRGD